MLAGMWVLVLLTLMYVLSTFQWTSSVPVPTVFDFRGTVRTLDDTLVCSWGVYQPLIFCIGVVLLFCAAQVLFIAALVLAGIAALFQSMPLKYQPGVTHLFVQLSTAYLRY